jgi:hypothetical protein
MSCTPTDPVVGRSLVRKRGRRQLATPGSVARGHSRMGERTVGREAVGDKDNSVVEESTHAVGKGFGYVPRASRLSATVAPYSSSVIRTTAYRKPAAAFAWTSGFDAVGSIRCTTVSIGTAGSHSST